MSSKLTIDELTYVQNEVKQKGKSLSISYLLLLTFGFVGIHLGYLERTKSAILRAFLTILTAALLYPIARVIIEFNSVGVTTELQQYSALLLVFSILTIGLNIVWTIYDLVSLPTMVKEKILEIEKEFSIKAVEARYVKEKLQAEEVSDYLVDKTSKAMSKKIDKFFEDEKTVINSELKKYEKELISKREEIVDLIEHVTSNLEEIQGYQENLDSQVRDLSISQNEKIEAVNDEINSKIENIEKNLSKTYTKTEIAQENNKEVLSVAEAIKRKQGAANVRGFIVGNMSPNRQRVSFDYFDNEGNIAIADNPSETDRKNMIVIQLTWESGLRNKLSLTRNDNLLHKEIEIEGELVEYFKGPGAKNLISVTMMETQDKIISNDI